MDLLVFVLLNNSEKSKNKMLPNIFQKKTCYYCYCTKHSGHRTTWKKKKKYVKYWQRAHISSANFTCSRLICKFYIHSSDLPPSLAWCFRLGNLTLTQASSHSVFFSRINAASVSFSPWDPVGCSPSPAQWILNLPIHSGSPEDTRAHFLWTWITLHLCSVLENGCIIRNALTHMVSITMFYHEQGMYFFR